LQQNDGADPRIDPFSLANCAAVTTHINLLQAVISRLANNSVQCKTWSLALVGAFLSLAGAAHNAALIDFVPLPLIVFGYADARYLAQEKAYRCLYAKIVGHICKGTYDQEQLFAATAPSNFCNFAAALGSWSIWPIYGVLLLAYAGARYFGVLAVITASAK